MGKLAVVGIDPGNYDNMTVRADQALAQCDVIIGYHVYVDLVKELIQRPVYDAPKFWINPEIKDFYDFTKDDVKVTDYRFGEQITIPVAV